MVIAFGYLGVVALSAVPFLSEAMAGKGDGSFSFLLVLLTTAPLGLLLLPLMSMLAGPLGDGRAVGAVVFFLYVVVALTQAWFLWRLTRGARTTQATDVVIKM